MGTLRVLLRGFRVPARVPLRGFRVPARALLRGFRVPVRVRYFKVSFKGSRTSTVAVQGLALVGSVRV